MIQVPSLLHWFINVAAMRQMWRLLLDLSGWSLTYVTWDMNKQTQNLFHHIISSGMFLFHTSLMISWDWLENT